MSNPSFAPEPDLVVLLAEQALAASIVTRECSSAFLHIWFGPPSFAHCVDFIEDDDPIGQASTTRRAWCVSTEVQNRVL